MDSLTPSTSLAQRWDNTDSIIAMMLSSSLSHSATVGGAAEANVAAEDSGADAVSRSILLVLLLFLLVLPVAVPALLDGDDERSLLFAPSSPLLSLFVVVVVVM